jgi:hypothetical protein
VEIHGAMAPLALFWQSRAAAAAELLQSLAADHASAAPGDTTPPV